MKIKYVTVISEDPATELDFFISVLGFRNAGNLELWPDINCTVLSQPGGDLQLALIPVNKNLFGKNVVIINTENCLRTFQLIQRAGINFEARPHYLSAGLLAEFKDKAGNLFILLEERFYENI